MISYAQNFEDVILNRAFRNRKTGFYIDVGAMDPVADSVTKFFYDQGWCGINIEPNEWFFNKLVSERERDINLNVALGEKEETRLFYVFKEYGISTFDEASRDRFIALGYPAEEKTINVRTLAAICREHVDRPIDFLKVDCEGWEKLALAGADWERFRPTVVVVEATLPLTTLPSWQEWDPILTEANHYEMVYFDGLNRFYLRRDSPGLRAQFGAPPNVFDGFKLHATETAEQASETLRRERDSLVQRISELESKYQLTSEMLAELQPRVVCETQRAAELETQVVREAQRFAELETQLADAAQRVAEMEAQAVQDVQRVGQLARELADGAQQVAELEAQAVQDVQRVAELETQAVQDAQRVAELEKERDDLRQGLLKTRLWVGQLSQDLAASGSRRQTR